MSIDRNHFSDSFVVFTIFLGIYWLGIAILLYLKWLTIAIYWFVFGILFTLAWNYYYAKKLKVIEMDDMTIEIDKDWEVEEI